MAIEEIHKMSHLISFDFRDCSQNFVKCRIIPYEFVYMFTALSKCPVAFEEFP